MGEAVGSTAGEAVGSSVGETAGSTVGEAVGPSVGEAGEAVLGSSAGETACLTLGEAVGSSVPQYLKGEGLPPSPPRPPASCRRLLTVRASVVHPPPVRQEAFRSNLELHPAVVAA